VLGSDNITVDGDQQWVMDQELHYAHRAGLSFFAYDTYCIWPTDSNASQCAGYWGGAHPTSYGYKPSNPAYGLDRHLNSSYAKLVNFTFVLLGASPVTDALRGRYLAKLKHPLYQRVLGDRPLVFLFQAGDNEAAMNSGWDAWRADWAAFRQASINQGSGNPYLVALGTNFNEALRVHKLLGFDAVSAYALPGGTLDGMPFDDQIALAAQFRADAVNASVEVVAPIPTGWDPRPRAAHPPVWVNESGAHFDPPTPSDLTKITADAIGWIKTNPSHAIANAALVYAWDENSEGGMLLPTLGNGTAMIDAMAAVLRP